MAVFLTLNVSPIGVPRMANIEQPHIQGAEPLGTASHIDVALLLV